MNTHIQNAKLINYVLKVLKMVELGQRKALLSKIMVMGNINIYSLFYHPRQIAFNWDDIVNELRHSVSLWDVVCVLIDLKLITDINLLFAWAIVDYLGNYSDSSLEYQLFYWYNHLDSKLCFYPNNTITNLATIEPEATPDGDGWEYWLDYDMVDFYDVGLPIGTQEELLAHLMAHLSHNTELSDLMGLDWGELCQAFVEISILWFG